MEWNGSIPVVMYHSVVPKEFTWSQICTPSELFEKQIEMLVSGGYTTVTLGEVIQHMRGEKLLTEKSIALTFDDGYLDNWLYAYPILKKYGYSATIFPSMEFIGSGKVRAYDKYAGAQYCGAYLNQNELKEMHDSCVFEVHSHTMTHTWYPSSNKVIALYTPQNRVPWLEWNLKTSSKSKWSQSIPYDTSLSGYPITQNGRALGVKRYVLNDSYIASFLKGYKNIDYRSETEVANFIARVASKCPDSDKGRFENREEFNSRVDYELAHSRDIIQKIVGKAPQVLCWPGGAKHTDIGQRWQDYGYIASTRAAGSSNGHRNSPGDDPSIISRIGCLGVWSRGSKYLGYFEKHALLHAIKIFQGNPLARYQLRGSKIKSLVLRNRCHSQKWSSS